MTENNIGRELKTARVISGLSQKDVAEQVGITPQYLCGVENGKYIPSARLLAALREAVGWTQEIADLVREADATTRKEETNGDL